MRWRLPREFRFPRQMLAGSGGGLTAVQMPPDNAAYFHAAYALAALIYVGYAALLVRRRARVRRALGAHDTTRPTPERPRP